MPLFRGKKEMEQIADQLTSYSTFINAILNGVRLDDEDPMVIASEEMADALLRAAEAIRSRLDLMDAPIYAGSIQVTLQVIADFMARQSVLGWRQNFVYSSYLAHLRAKTFCEQMMVSWLMLSIAPEVPDDFYSSEFVVQRSV